MSTFAERLLKSMELAGVSQAELVEKTGIGKSSISQYLSGLYEPKQKNIYRLATALKTDPAFLMGIDESIEKTTKDEDSSLPPLTHKDEHEIAKDLEAMLNALDSRSGMAAYDGDDPEDEEDRELLRASLLTSMRLAKQIAKKKFTPKKYRKE